MGQGFCISSSTELLGSCLDWTKTTLPPQDCRTLSRGFHGNTAAFKNICCFLQWKRLSDLLLTSFPFGWAVCSLSHHTQALAHSGLGEVLFQVKAAAQVKKLGHNADHEEAQLSGDKNQELFPESSSACGGHSLEILHPGQSCIHGAAQVPSPQSHFTKSEGLWGLAQGDLCTSLR